MRARILTALAMSLCVSSLAGAQEALRPPSGIGFEEPQAKLLVLGTFHFKDAGLDSYKPHHEVDILSPQRQDEVADLLERLAAFAPTRIAVEMDRTRQQVLDERYAAYLAGNFELKSNEIYQLGFRLGARLAHERLYAVDADGRRYEPYVDGEEFARRHDQAWVLDHPWNERYTKLYEWGDQTKVQSSLRDFLLYLNSPERVRLGHGHYFVGGFRAATADAYPGADNLSGWWYNRNLRIFANVLQLARGPEDRVLLIIGAGHVPIIRHAAEASPDVEWVEVADVLGDAPKPGVAARSFGNGLFVSEADPAMRVRIAPGFDYLGQDNFLLGVAGTHAVERHHWVRANERNEVRALITFQFESILPGVEGQYQFTIPPARSIAGGNYRFSPERVRLGSHDYVHNTWAFDTRKSAAENPGKESAQTLALLARHGYTIDAGLIMSRYVREVGADRRKEIILFYTEPLSAHGHKLAEFPETLTPSEIYDRLSAQVVARGLEAFEVLPDTPSTARSAADRRDPGAR